MVKVMSVIGSTGIAASTVLIIVGAFASIHMLITALITFASSVGLHGIASNRK